MVMVVVTMSRRHKPIPKADTLGILAFDAAKTISRLISLYNSLSDQEITKLRHEVIKSKGVAYLNSNHESFLLNLAAAERLEELDLTAATVSRFGQKCSDLGLSRFDLVYADLKNGIIDLRKLQYNSRNVHKIVNKTEKLVSATASLHAAMESVADMEAAEKKRQRLNWNMNNNNNTTCPKPNMEYSNDKIVFERKQVQHLKGTSLWEQTFDKTVGIMARLVCIVYARICSVFGPYIAGCNKISSNNVFLGIEHSCLLEHRELYKTTRGIFELYEESKHKRVTMSGPIPKSSKAKLQTNPLPMDFASGNNDKVLNLAPPSTVGGAGLTVRYANVILLAEQCLHAPATVGEDAREALYEMLPMRLRGKVGAKLRGRWVKEEEGGDGEMLAEGWREAVDEMMEWLLPVANDTVRWQGERHLEKTRFDTKPTALLLQTLHYSDLEKAEAAIVEVLVGLSCIYWCERKL